MSEALLQSYRSHLSANYAALLERLDLATTVAEARGAIIRDSRGRSFIDFVSGYGVFNFGHNPPEVIGALRRELDASPLWNRPFVQAPLARLAERLSALTEHVLDKVLPCSSGAEAVDSAVKLARMVTRRTEIVAAQGAFHGFTLGALSVSGIPVHSRAYAPLLPDVAHVPFGDAGALAARVSRKTAAVILEPIQAEVGAEDPPPGYLAEARAICDAADALLIVDEVRTGMGRTGSLFAIRDEGVMPDILLIGKSLTSGIDPIGAMLARGRLWQRLELSFSMAASSFSGNRLACVAALATLDLAERSDILSQSRESATVLRQGLDALPSRYPDILHRVSGRGLLIGLHFASPAIALDVIRASIQRGLLIAAAFCNNRCVLLEPPLSIDRAELRQALDILAAACQAVAAAGPPVPRTKRPSFPSR